MDKREDIISKKKVYAHQDDLGLVKFLLDAHDVVRMPRILVLLEVGVDIRERDRRRVGEGRLGNFGRKIIKELGEE